MRFFYVPVKAFGPAPASGATGVALDAVLNWRPGREAVTHEVYLSTDPNAVAKGTAPVKTVTEHSFGLGSLGLEYGTTYYWKVNEVNDAAATKSWEGDVWSFTTSGMPSWMTSRPTTTSATGSSLPGWMGSATPALRTAV